MQPTDLVDHQNLRDDVPDLDAGDFIVPIWRIDDEPVYGIPWDLCQGAQRHSDKIVEMGYEPSWPGLTCANVSYAGPERSYSRTVTLTQGAHKLYAGTLQKVCPLLHFVLARA